MLCRWCARPIKYEHPDAVYAHIYQDWGSNDVKHPNYNNRYYCDEGRTKSAEPGLTVTRVTQLAINDHAREAWLTEDMEDEDGEPWGV